MSWPVNLVVASHVHSHICCVTGVMALKKTRFAHRYIVHCFSITIYLKAKKYFHTFDRNFAGAGEIFVFALVSAILLACLTGPWHRCPEKAFVKSIWVIRELTDGVTLVEKSCIMQLLRAFFFSARGNIVRIDSCTDDSIRISLTVAIRSVHRRIVTPLAAS